MPSQIWEGFRTRDLLRARSIVRTEYSWGVYPGDRSPNIQEEFVLADSLSPQLKEESVHSVDLSAPIIVGVSSLLFFPFLRPKVVAKKVAAKLLFRRRHTNGQSRLLRRE